jgi:hypothetical protein
MAETVEIRVHGVSGTPPQSLLEIESIRQVDGDDTARFFRHSPAPPASGTRCEAFHWGTMTSGSISKALWLLMAPFGVINLARYTLPMESRTARKSRTEGKSGTGGESGAGGESRAGRELGTEGKGKRARQIADGSLRLLGLVLTVLLVTTVAFVSIDLVAWQCGGNRACARQVPLIGSRDFGWSWRLAFGAAVPAALVWLLGSFSTKVYLHPARLASPTKAEPKAEAEREAKPDPVGALDQREFWSPAPRTALLRLLHLTTALAVVAMVVSHLSTHKVRGFVPAGGWSHTVLWTLFWAAAAIAVWCVVVTAAGRALGTEDADAAVDPSAVPAAYRWLNKASWTVLAGVAVIAACWGSSSVRTSGSRPARLTGFDWAFQAHYAAAALLLLVLAGANFALSRRFAAPVPTPYRRMWSGMACTVLTGFAVLLATGFTSGLALQTARLLGHPDEVAKTRQPLELPELFHVTALLWGLLVVPLILVAAVFLICRCLWPRLPGGMDLHARIKDDYPGEDVRPRTVKGIGAAWRRGRLKYQLPRWLAWLGGVGAVASLVQGLLAVFAVLPGKDPGPGWLRRNVYGDGGRETFFSFCDEVLGTWVLTGIAAGLAFLGVRAFRSPAWRRSVGVLWDLLAFWPRLTHPIVPPPYGGRAVLALAQRVEDKTVDGGKVVLSGHSQGSLVCVAAALTVAPGARERLALVTHGSQLMWAYARLFPTYVGYEALNALYAQLPGRWRNLHRWSDYLGGPVLARPASDRLDPAPIDTAWTAIDGTPAGSVPAGGTTGSAISSATGGTNGGASSSATGGTNGGATDGVWLRRMGPEYQLRDPHNVNARDGHPASPLLAHSSYYADPAYDVVVQELADAIGLPERGVEASAPVRPRNR